MKNSRVKGCLATPTVTVTRRSSPRIGQRTHLTVKSIEMIETIIFYVFAVATVVCACAVVTVAADGDVELSAENKTASTVVASAKQTGGASSAGVGASVALHIAPGNLTRAEIENGSTLTGADDVTLDATSSHTATNLSEAGAASTGSAAVAPTVAISIVNNDTYALIGGEPDAVADYTLVTTGDVSATAEHVGSTTTKAVILMTDGIFNQR